MSSCKSHYLYFKVRSSLVALLVHKKRVGRYESHLRDDMRKIGEMKNEGGETRKEGDINCLP